MPRGPQLPRDLVEKLQGENYNDWNQTHNFRGGKSRKQQRKEQRQQKKGAKPYRREEISSERKMTAEETMAALAAAKKRKAPVDSKPSTKPEAKKPRVTPFVSLHEEEVRRKDEEDAKYYAKKLGLKSLKLPKGDDELGDLLGDLDFDRFSDLDKNAGSSSESDSDIEAGSDLDDSLSAQDPDKEQGSSNEDEIFENPWTDDSLSEGDFESGSEEEAEDEVIENPWTDDSLSEGDFENGENEETAHIDNPWTDDSLSEGDFESGEEVSAEDEEEESGSEPEMTAEQTMAALKAKKAKKSGRPDVSEDMTAEETMAALKAAKAAKTAENPYVPAGGKYVPPSRRKLESTTKSEEELKLQRLVKSALNKLAEANLGSIVNEIENYFTQYSRALVSSTLTAVVIDSVSSQGTLQANFLTVHAGLIGALYRTVGVDFGAEFIQTLVETFEKAQHDSSSPQKANNLVQLLAECYSMQVIAPRLIYDIVRELLGDLTENNTELLLSIIRSCGTQLRSDDPESLKEIIVLLQSTVGKQDQASLSPRTKFLVESIVALKNQRQKAANEGVIELRRRLRKVLGSIKGQGSDPLRVSLEDIRNVETRGKWWIVGAAWAGQSSRRNTEDVDQNEVDDMLGSAEPNWLELARKQRLNTDIRRAVFVALMGAEDYIDACQRIDKLHLKNKQAREVPHVILHCCSNEQTYNPYYALVAAKQCTQHQMRKTLQFTLWDFFGVLEAASNSVNVQKIMHYARFYASLVAQGALGLDILKTVDFLSANDDLKVFLEVFFVYLYRTLGKQAEQNASHNMVEGTRRDAKGLAQLLSQTKDRSVLRGIQYIQPQVASSTAVGTGKNAARVQWCCNLVTDVVQELAAREHSAELGL